MAETLVYLYTSQKEIERIWSPKAAAVRLDDSRTGNTDVNLWNDIIFEATDTVNLYLQPFYNDIDLQNNLWVRRCASYIGCYLLSLHRGNPPQFKVQYERMVELLEKVQDGRMQIPRLPTNYDYTPGMSNYAIDDYYNINKVRVEPTISTGGTGGNQDIDRILPNNWF